MSAPSLEATGEVLRAGAAALALFGLAGYAPARLLAPAALRECVPLLVLPAGAAVSALALTLLGFLQVPLAVSLAAVLAAGAAAAAAVRVRRGPLRLPAGREAWLRLAAPAAVALAVAGLAAAPMFRAGGLATVYGQNGDAHLVTGSAELLRHAPPGSVRPELPVDEVPQFWSSKYPIYYSLAGVSELAGIDPVQAFATLSAIVLALAALGFYLLARGALGAGAGAALLAMGAVALDRQLHFLALHPFYNQLWGLFAFPFVLLAGLLYLREPGRASLGLLLLFGAIAAFAYPLLLPLPALFLAVAGALIWRRRRAEGRPAGWVSALRLPRGRRSLLLWVPVGVIAGPVALLLVAAALDKLVGGVRAALPGGDLAVWSGTGLPYVPLARFAGLPTDPEALAWVVLPLLLALAALALWSAPREAAAGLAAMLAAVLLAAAWFRLRGEGQLFHFKLLSFVGPLVLLLAALGLAGLARTGRVWGRQAVEAASSRPGSAGAGARTLAVRAAALASLAALATVLALETRAELRGSQPHAGEAVWELREWSQRLPAGASIRVDVLPFGVQQWAWYMLHEHPLTASDPLREFFPHPPVGRRADYLLVNAGGPPDATGRPLLANRDFRLYRIHPSVPGPDRSSRRMVQP